MRVIYCNLKGNIQISSLKSPSYHTGSWGAQFLHRSFFLAKAFCYTRISLVQPSWAWVFPQLKIQKDAKSAWWLHGLRDTFGFNMQIRLNVSWCDMSWRYMCRKRRSSFLQLRAPNLTVVFSASQRFVHREQARSCFSFTGILTKSSKLQTLSLWWYIQTLDIDFASQNPDTGIHCLIAVIYPSWHLQNSWGRSPVGSPCARHAPPSSTNTNFLKSSAKAHRVHSGLLEEISENFPILRDQNPCSIADTAANSGQDRWTPHQFECHPYQSDDIGKSQEIWQKSKYLLVELDGQKKTTPQQDEGLIWPMLQNSMLHGISVHPFQESGLDRNCTCATSLGGSKWQPFIPKHSVSLKKVYV